MAIGLKLRNLLFVIHAVAPERVRRFLPAGLEPDVRETPDGPRAFLATVALESGAAFPYVLTGFRQVNYRIYVRHRGEPGVMFLRSWVSSRTAAAAMSLAIPTEHADVEMEIQDGAAPYSHFTVHGRSGDHELELEAQADPQPAALPYFATAEEGFDFLTHRLTGFATGRNGLSVVRVEHPHMHPLRARIEAKRADEWTAQGVLTPEEVRHPLLALIQPEVQFDMNLPERVAAS
ncbi:MAG TPA: DUF2071 domain-containing protein [Terriglobales bacterium]|nr:DUF2071 domain-containing protein [Terriglobales bacterium]